MFMANNNQELECFLYDDQGLDGDSSNQLDKYMTKALLNQSDFDIIAWWKKKTK